MLQPPAEDIPRRRPVWSAMSELFLDTELDVADLRWIARVLAGSGYTDAELATIMEDEVYPACIGNLLQVAGEWAGIDADWLQARILAHYGRRWGRWLPRGHWRLIWDEWQSVMELTREARRQAAQP